jgi:kumamolisin
MTEQNPSPQVPATYRRLERSAHPHSEKSTPLGAVDVNEPVTVTLILRRRPGAQPITVEDFTKTARSERKRLSHEDFANTHGAAPEELERVAEFARGRGLQVLEMDQARRSVVVRGTAAQVNTAFAVELRNYDLPRHRYRGFEGTVSLPTPISEIVQTVVGLDNRPVPATRGPATRASDDPPGTSSLTPVKAAQLYAFPAGSGAGQTIGIYEMVTDDPVTGIPQNPGYTGADIASTMNAFGGGLTVPTPVDVAVGGQNNAGVSDGETVLDITVAGAVAQGATLAVYFTGGDNQSIIRALQRMIHPSAGDPVPTVITISYGWGPDDDTQFTTPAEFSEMDQLFQDAASLDITVLVSTGDSGAMIQSTTQAQVSFPATDPWVIACGGTTIGNIGGGAFDEVVWNDTFGQNSGATGGGVSVLFSTVPSYQDGLNIPTRVNTGTVGRGIPDIAGNASPNSGYAEFLGGNSVGPTGGTSAVAPLYAGLMAVINANLGSSAGFINPLLYSLAGSAFKDTLGAPGPANNSFQGVTGYSAGPGWDACTGLGSLNGTALLKALQAAK